MKEATSNKLEEAIAGGNAAFMQAFGRGDAGAVAALYTENALLLPPTSDVVRGRAAIQAFWQVPMNMGVKAAKLESVEIEGHGVTAIEVGKYELYAAGQQRVDKGKYVVIWKQERGEWRLWRDIWNTSLPPPA